MKHCPKCGETKPLDGFNKFHRSSDGRQGYCRECAHEYRRTYQKQNPEKYRRYKQEYRDRNPEKVKAKDSAYYAANRDAIAARAREYRASNRDELNAWRKARPEIGWVSQYRIRARECGHAPAVEDFTKADVIDRYGDSCVYCESGAFEHLDHYMPVSEGGPHTLDNVRPSCAKCNLAKYRTPGSEWAGRVEKIHDRASQVRGW